VARRLSCRFLLAPPELCELFECLSGIAQYSLLARDLVIAAHDDVDIARIELQATANLPSIASVVMISRAQVAAGWFAECPCLSPPHSAEPAACSAVSHCVPPRVKMSRKLSLGRSLQSVR